jgi:hypothetical protein
MSAYKLSDAARAAALELPSGSDLVAYFEERVPVGGFLSAVLENNLLKAAAAADNRNKSKLFEYASWLYNYAPVGSYGSREKVEAWIGGGGANPWEG